MQNRIQHIRSKATTASFAVLLLFASTMAHFSSSDTVTNRIKAGSLDITLTETKWKPEAAKNIVPDEILDKNPEVLNSGKNDGYIFLKVTVPYISATKDIDYSRDITDENGKTIIHQGQKIAVPEDQREEPLPLFKFIIGEKMSETITKEQLVYENCWTLVDGYPLTNTKNAEIVYVYAYTQKQEDGTAQLKPLKQGETTEKQLFDKIKLINFSSGLVTGTYSVNVEAFGIQSDYLDSLTASDISEIWNFLNKEVSGGEST